MPCLKLEAGVTGAQFGILSSFKCDIHEEKVADAWNTAVEQTEEPLKDTLARETKTAKVESLQS